MKLADYGVHSSSFFQTSNISSYIQCWLPTEILKCKHKKDDNFTEKSDISVRIDFFSNLNFFETF